MTNLSIWALRTLFLVPAAVVVSLIGCDAKTQPEPKSGPSEPPALKIAASELCQQMRKDNNATGQKYKLKRLEISGVVSGVQGSNFAGRPSIRLYGFDSTARGKKPDDEYAYAECTFGSDFALKVLALVPGQSVKITGIYNGLTAVALERCDQFEAGPLPVAEWSPAELRQKLGAKPTESAVQEMKPIVLKGALSSITPPPAGKNSWHLAWEDSSKSELPALNVRAEIAFAKAFVAFEGFIKSLKAGSTVRVYGQLSYYDGVVTLRNPQLIPD